MIAAIEVLSSYFRTKRLSRPGLSRADFEAAQTRALARWLHNDLPQVRAYAAAPARLSDLPITDKAQLMAQFHRYNRPGLTAEQAWAGLEGGKIGRLTIGCSTGTSGNRGLFVISEAERFRWLGSILAKCMDGLLTRPSRVAIVLPRDTRLYHAARRLPWLQLRVFDITIGPVNWRAELESFAPTVLLAPPRLLRHFAESRYRLQPQRIFAAAETLDPPDRPMIEGYFNRPLDQIYMATEGLFATTCRHGGLHLAEDATFFEFEPAGDGLVTPLVTAFRRETQIMARYRMNDLLRLADTPCSCGSPLRHVHEIVGRMDDCFRLAGGVLLTPDVLRNAVLSARDIDDFRLVQRSGTQVELLLPPELPEASAQAAATAVQALLNQRSPGVQLTLTRRPLPLDATRKLRRVECALPQALP
ncbi:CoF synthetase [Xinfangfangia sp. CPCC 101601]|uniref:CoF synthetase n=1 Tax=Pseudogemmobacter lacusdianii TaxID=3069608 RepID=A0ABU0W1D3_9RHOB|nr:CoF synthetase [Xinfangfangia sp. CPCC 101601]MDQ2067831.1 CoF synthetase [Xinfangfangia sp. CPCC 101601]